MSRFSTRVSIDDASMVASIFAEAGSLPLTVIVPEVFWNCPFTFEIIMWRTVNSTLVCIGSICQVSACARIGSAATIAIAIAAFVIQDFISGLLRLERLASIEHTKWASGKESIHSAAASIPTDLRMSSTIPLIRMIRPQITTVGIGPRCDPM